MKSFVYSISLFGACFFIQNKVLAQQNKDIRTVFADFDGHRCFARAVGLTQTELPLLVLVHGAPGDWTAWKSYLSDSLLQQQYRMIAIDRMGYGASEPTQMFGLSAQVAAVAAIIAKFSGGKSVVLAGHSVGGAVVMAAALRPDLPIKRTFLLAPAIAEAHERPRWYNYIGAWAWVRKMQSLMWRITNDEMMALPASLAALDAQYAALKTPVTLLHGRLDMIAPFGNARYLTEKIDKKLLERHIFAYDNHFIPWKRFKEVKALLLECARETD